MGHRGSGYPDAASLMVVDTYKIISNAFVITCDPLNRGGQYNILVRNDRIAAMSDRPDLLPALYPGATMIDASQKLVIPGFVNAHFHSDSILLSRHTENIHFSLWDSNPVVQRCIKDLLDPLNKDHVRNVYLMSYFRHLRSGTTCVGEYGLPFPENVFTRALHSIERTEVKTAIALQNWDQISMVQGVKRGDRRYFVNVGKEDEFTVYGFEGKLRVAKEMNVPLLAHVAEQRASTEFVRKAFQRSVLSVLQDFGVVQPDTAFIHLNHMGAPEAEALAEAGASVIVCARSAALKRTGYPFLRYLARERIPLAVGTDWGNVDMLEELQFLHQLHLLVSGIPPISPLQLVRMGTINGARALALSGDIGSIEVGKKADLTFYSLEDLRVPALPANPDSESLSSLLLNHLTNRDVSDVMINGEFYVAKGEVMTMAQEELIECYRTTCSLFSYPRGEMPSAVVSNAKRASAESAPRILPFTSTSRRAHQDEGFEVGFRPEQLPFSADNGTNDAVKTQSTRDAADPGTSVPASKDQTKEIWRTFGEEDF